MKIQAHFLFRLFNHGFAACCCAALAISLLAILGSWHWICELFDHFRIQYVVISLLSLIYFSLRKWRCSIGFASLTLLVHLWPIGKLSFPLPVDVASDGTPAIKIVSFNVLVSNNRYGDTLRYLESTNADVICLYEVNEKWHNAMKPLRQKYPHGRTQTTDRSMGIELFSRHPLRRIEIKKLCEEGMPCAIAQLEWQGREMRLIGFHPLPPISKRLSHLLKQEFASMATLLAASPNVPTLVFGDFNTTPWSSNMTLLRTVGAVDFRTPQPVWKPTWNANTLYMLPIDHALCSKHLIYQKRIIGPNLGSDHLPQELHAQWIR